MADRLPRIPFETNDRAACGSDPETLHRLFEEQVERQPDAVAVEDDSGALTYGELNRWANRLARHLRRIGVGPDVLVALCVERSLDAIVGIFGILKAGGAYLPLDPSYPRERLRFMVEDSGAQALVTHGAAGGCGVGLVPSDRLVFLDSAEPDAGDGAENVESGVGPRNLAYVIYTSGSTGKPKGVEIEHGGLVNHARWFAGRFGISTGERMLQFASLGFDASVQEISSSLVGGATLVIRSEEMLAGVSTFLAACRERELTVIDVPTAYWHELVSAASAEGLRFPEGLRLVVIGGERALPERFAQWRDLTGGRLALVNAYGPTEGTIAATFWEAPRENPPEAARTVPIGRPLPNVQTYVLDRKLRPVPIGVVGDLYIGGVGVARGYRNRPELTAERFIPDPFRGGDGRLYRTGDRARVLPSGNLEYLGRADGQIKLRGFRIELGEIETAIRAVPGVREAVVRLHEDAPGDARLVAHVVTDPGEPFSAKDLRRLLKQSLPLHMIPSTFVRLDAMPLNRSGKIDASALPPPGPAHVESAEDYVEPRTPVERRLAGIWAEVMRIDRVGVDQDFFDLGGHSLLAMQLISRIRDAFGVALPVRELFASPTVAGLASRIEPRLAAKGGGGAAERKRPQEIVRRGAEAPAPLSSSQERLWVLDALVPGSSLYNIPYAARLRGPLDAEALARAFDAVERRHEVLRSVFSKSGKELVQTLASGGRSLERADLSAVPGELREAEILRRAVAEARRPFDLERGPFFRTHLLRLSEDDHVLIVTFHHVVFDGWSVPIFAREVAAFYSAFREGRDADLPTLPIQYADYSAWQRRSLEEPAFADLLAHWRRQLRGAPPVIDLPTDRPRPAAQSYGGAEETLSIPTPVSDAIRSISHREGATLFMTLLAAFQAFLGRHGAQDDMLVGTPVSGRNRSEAEGLIGFFVNTLVFRADLSGDPTFRQLLGRVRETALEAYSHDGLPFEALVEELNPERTLSHSPLVQVMMVLQDRPRPLALPGVSSSPIPVAPTTAKFDLTAVFENAGGELTASFQYSTDLFDRETVARMLGRLNVLLAGIAENPDVPVSRLPILTEEERELSVVRWNDTATEYPRESSIHHLFEHEAASTPDAEAVVFGDTRLTYRELNERANRLARHLMRRGVVRGDLVGLCLERSAEMVVGILAILKAGGAYVPIDPGYPRQRLTFMLEDARLRLVLTEESFLEALPEGLYDCIQVDADRSRIEAESGENPGVTSGAEDLAYVMYTSGSTGTPKGVCIRHRSVVRLVRGADYASFRGEVFLQFASISFDASTFEIWGALLNGARLVVMPPGIPSLQELAETVQRQSVTTLWLTAGLFHQMVETEVEGLRGLRQLLAGGDVLSVAHVRKALAGLPDCRLINGYGPTESTTFACCHTIGRDELFLSDELVSSVPIGRPIANTRVYVLDRNRRPVPVGVAGELCIGGDGLARDYLRRPELTAQKFFEDPFEAGGRLYATGDRARWRNDGTLEFLGRIDEQLKVRGFRIEPGEIESVLARQASVAASVVIAREDVPGDRRLVAYVVRRDGGRDPIPGLRELAASSLPDHMVPSAFVFLDALPLTANGKVDRRALPAPRPPGPGGETFAAPGTDLEKALAAIWSDVLGIDRVGLHDNFFELGGHSLLATSMISRVRDSLHLEISLRTLFKFPTVARFAQALSGGASPGGERGEVSQPLADRVSWWKTRLADLPYIDLPADGSRSPIGSPRTVHDDAFVPPRVAAALKSLSAAEEATLSMTLLAVFQILIARQTGQEDVTVGANGTVLRTDLSGEPTFVELLARVRHASLETAAHELPFDRLAEALGMKPDVPLTRIFFVMSGAAPSGPRHPVDLELTVLEEKEGLALRAAYDGGRFEAARVAEWLGQFGGLLEQVADAPRERIRAYSLVTAAALRLLPDPAIPIPAPPMGLVSDAVVTWSARTPLAPAIVEAGGVSTYEDVERRSRRIAETLVARGVAPGDVVAVEGPRGAGLIAAMLGVLRGGGVLLTLDPVLPDRRRAWMLAEAGAHLVLQVRTAAEKGKHARGPRALPWIELDEKGELPEGPAGSEAPGGTSVSLPLVRPGDPAYIFFTSGTSGVPKAVLGSHKALSHYLEWERSTFAVVPGDRCSHLTALSFDAVLRDIFVPLTSGASLHVPDRSEEAGSDRVVSWLEREGITILHAVPSLVQTWLDGPPPEAGLARLRLIFLAGEPLTDALVRRWRSAFPASGRIVNLYGPTETTLVKCFFVVPEPPLPGIQPIGRPLPNTQALVLGDGARPCGIGEAGEIVLRTPFASLGYLNAPGERRDRFVPNPFRSAAEDCDLLYRTGDRGRYGVDGSIFIHGRLDDQVKVRGVRIEPAEVAAVLSTHPRVRSCCVVSRIGAQGDVALNAYVVCDEPGSGLSVELRRHLLAELPSAMIPSAFVYLERLPLTPNGKLDRAALPPPEESAVDADRPAAREVWELTRMEKSVALIWTGVLGAKSIGPDDDFFALGGHSMNAAEVMYETTRVVGIDLPAQMLFEHPTLAGLSAAIEREREKKNALAPAEGGSPPRFERDEPQPPPSPAPSTSAAPAPSAATRAPSIRRRTDPKAPAPLSFAQQRLWLLDRLDPGQPTYNVPRAFRLRGALDVEALRRALEALQERHEVLRTCFPMEGVEVRSVVRESTPPLSVIDLGTFDEAGRETEAQRLVEADAAGPFDLARGPLFRATLLRLDPLDSILLVNIHHVAFDGWSVQVFDRELAVLYASYRDGSEKAMPVLPIQYADFAVWQLEWFKGKVLNDQLGYWKRQLAEAPAVFELSAGRRRPSVQTFRGAEETFSIAKSEAEAIRSLGRSEGATMFMTLLAAFQVLLMRHSGQEDILVGSPVAGRNQSEIESLIGFFVNTLVFRGNLSGDPTFRELLGRVRETSIEAYAHQDLPFERLVEELNPERSLSHSPLFQVMMILNERGRGLSLPGLASEPVKIASGAAKFDLTLTFGNTRDEVAASLQYNVDLLDAAAAKRMVSAFRVLLRSIAEDPDRRISQLPLLTAREKRQVLADWNDTAAEYPHDLTLHELFERQVDRTPDAIAVREGKAELTFRELDRRANRLAHHLRRRGAGSESPVAILLDRSARVPEALLAVLKAGGAWVPLDPSSPPDRLAFMLRDSGARWLLTETGRARDIETADVEVIRLDSDAGWGDEPDSRPSGGAGPGDLAYVIYTSGSTGMPKGVDAIHRACVNRLAWMWRAYPFAPGEVCCQKTALSFVDSIWEVFGPLLQGVPIVVLPDETVRDPRALVESLAAARVTRIVLVPSLLTAIVDSGIDLGAALPDLHLWVSSGETLSPDLYRRFRAAAKGASLINLYGSSEVSADVTCWDGRMAEARDGTPIGRPIANTQIYILDTHGQPVPIGVPGEIYVGGHGVARGYRNRPDLTSERFLPDRFGRASGGTLFRTGDRGRYREDGQIEYLGRTDLQVKLRGRRIEPGEIESALGAHPAIAQSVVCLREDEPGQSRLVAYVVPQPGSTPSPVELRTFLRRRLPDFMVPPAFVFLEALPLTVSGKVDRIALPAPDGSRPDVAVSFVAPRNSLEQRVALIWRETLGLAKVGVHDNFFDLGGHSLLAVSLAARLGEEFGRDIALATIFRAPTVAEIAEIFREKRRSRRKAPSLVAVQPLGSRPPFYCVHAVGGLVYYGSLARVLGNDQPFYGLQSQGLDGRRTPYETVEEMAAHYVREIRAVQPEGPYYLGGYSFGGKVAFEMARQLHAQGQRTAFLAIVDTFNLPISPGPSRFEVARRKTQVHFSALKTAGTKEKLTYLLAHAGTLRSLARRALARGKEALFHPKRRAHRRVLEANTRADKRYVPGFYPGHATIFRAMERTEDLRDKLRPFPHLGWEKLCGEGLELVEVPGGHGSLLGVDANVRALGDRLAECIRAAQDRGTAREQLTV